MWESAIQRMDDMKKNIYIYINDYMASASASFRDKNLQKNFR